MPGIVYQSFALWSLACDARERAGETLRADPHAYARDATVAVVLAAASTEAFINEFTESVLLYQRSKDCQDEVTPSVGSCATILKEVDRDRGSISQKYLWAAYLLSGKCFDKGKNPYQDFKLLIDLRNSLMHLKPDDDLTYSEHGAIVITPSETIEVLQRRKFAREDNASGFNLIQTEKVAEWACNAAKHIILAVLNMIPDEPAGPAWSLKVAFREYSGTREERERVLAKGTPPGSPGAFVFLEADAKKSGA
jgi:hypothetical protein